MLSPPETFGARLKHRSRGSRFPTHGHVRYHRPILFGISQFANENKTQSPRNFDSRASRICSSVGDFGRSSVDRASSWDNATVKIKKERNLRCPSVRIPFRSARENSSKAFGTVCFRVRRRPGPGSQTLHRRPGRLGQGSQTLVLSPA